MTGWRLIWKLLIFKKNPPHLACCAGVPGSDVTELNVCISNRSEIIKKLITGKKKGDSRNLSPVNGGVMGDQTFICFPIVAWTSLCS